MRTRPGRFAPARRAALLAGLLSAAALAAPASAAATSTAISSNWAGYVAQESSSGSFQSVSGAWTVPRAACTAGRETHSAVWVGLGGYAHNAKALEQIGTEADCASTGHAVYESWVELLPANAQTLRLKVSPGDRVVASVTVAGRHATLRLRDLTTARRYSTTRRLSAIDVSSADWIVEAPSGCDSDGDCRTLALTDFGTVAISGATATAAGRTAALAAWDPVELILRQGIATASGAYAAPERTLVRATPGAYAGSDFSVSYGEATGSQAPEGPRLPGFEGGGAGP